VEDLSGGELQRFAIAMVCIQKADMLVFYAEHHTWLKFQSIAGLAMQ